MIYFKINKDVYNENNLKELFNSYPFSKAKIIYRIVKRQFNTILKNYPEIDIVINFKNIENVLGRFYKHRLYKGIEYKFLGDKINPCIVLFWSAINDFYLQHSIKGLQKVLYHEFGHFKQWLLTDNCNHNRKLKAKAVRIGLNKQINDCKEYLNITK